MLHLQSITYLGISWKFEVIIFETDDYMDVRNNMCNQVWNVTSRMALTVWLRQSVGLYLFVD